MSERIGEVSHQSDLAHRQEQEFEVAPPARHVQRETILDVPRSICARDANTMEFGFDATPIGRRVPLREGEASGEPWDELGESQTAAIRSHPQSTRKGNAAAYVVSRWRGNIDTSACGDMWRRIVIEHLQRAQIVCDAPSAMIVEPTGMYDGGPARLVDTFDPKRCVACEVAVIWIEHRRKRRPAVAMLLVQLEQPVKISADAEQYAVVTRERIGTGEVTREQATRTVN